MILQKLKSYNLVIIVKLDTQRKNLSPSYQKCQKRKRHLRPYMPANSCIKDPLHTSISIYLIKTNLHIYQLETHFPKSFFSLLNSILLPSFLSYIVPLFCFKSSLKSLFLGLFHHHKMLQTKGGHRCLKFDHDDSLFST